VTLFESRRPVWLSANLQGMMWMLVTTVLIVTMHTMIRDLAEQGLHPFQIGFFRTFFGFPVVIVLLMKYGLGILKTDQIKVHGIRSFGHVAAMMLFFLGLSMTPLATANALAFTAPLFATVLAVVALGETIRWRRWAALIFGFAGTLVIIRPGIVEVGTGPILVLVSSAIWAVILIIIKTLGKRDATPTIVTYMVLFMSPIALIPALFVWVWPSWEQLGVLLIMGVMGTAAHLTLTQALRLGDAAVVMLMDFFKLIWSAAFGYLIFAELPTLYTWLGGSMIFASATYIALRERALSRARLQADKDV